MKLYKVLGALFMAMGIIAFVELLLPWMLFPKLIALLMLVSALAWFTAGYGLFKGRLWGWILSTFLTALSAVSSALLIIVFRMPIYLLLIFYVVVLVLLILSAGQLGVQIPLASKQPPPPQPVPYTAYRVGSPPALASASVFVEPKKFVRRK